MRNLTEREIDILEEQGCSAEDWTEVTVDEDDFRVERVRDTGFYGPVAIGGLAGTMEMEEGFELPCGIRHARLRNVSVGSNCLIENVAGYISNYDIGDGSLVSNVGIVTTQGSTTFGNGTAISVLCEGGDGNVILYDKLTAQTAQLMLAHPDVRQMVTRELANRPFAEHGSIGQKCRIVGVSELCNVSVGDACEIQGSSRLRECTVLSSDEASTLIGPDVIAEGCIIAEGATVTDGAKIYNSFVGESVHIGKGFSAEASLFFANSYLDNGEACAAFCGPFSTSHHKSTLLIGGQFSFYNAGSATNQSNHAYKMGPIHYGTLERGAKTASGCHILWPAHIGAFSMVMGKLTTHPQLAHLPFSYVIASESRTVVVPGINLRTVGTWRDVGKWPKRDLRPRTLRRDIVNYAFPNPFIIQQVLEGKSFLERKLETDDGGEYIDCGDYVIKRTAAVTGTEYYDLAIRLFIYSVLNGTSDMAGDTGIDTWLDLSGMLAPQKEIGRIVADIRNESISTTDELLLVLSQVHADYASNAASYAHNLMQQMNNSMFIDQDYWLREAEQAHERWLHMVRDDAEHEFQLGDVDEETLRTFLDKVK